MTSKVVFITGAGSGIGRLAAQRHLAAGDRVAAADINDEGLAPLGTSDRLLRLALDVTDMKAVQAAVAQVEAAFGPVDRVVHAAAIMPLGCLLDQPAELILRIMAINYGGLVNVAHALIPGMNQRGQGEFVSFASTAGHIPILFMGAYDASKSAVCAFTEVLHHENLGRGVRICCVCPPPVATPLLDQARSTVWPKMFNETEPITAQTVLDSVEQALKRGDFWVFPGRMTRWYVLARRLFPGLLWRRVHQVEGR